ncbi:DUF2255 family protein [Dactylosporangium sp. NPDC051485]|uniref:DUF2255 family protein n=1 Tax=Dactylosporangium sp. NPDC051485 TaxID=3154846 RepID=UPI003426C78C
MTWDTATPRQLADAAEVEVVVPAPGRPEVRTPIWIVAVDDTLYVRSWKGETGIWYRRARRHGTGSVNAAGREHHVRFTAVDEPDTNARIDEAYRNKYSQSTHTQTMTRPPATTTTLRLDPA